MAIAHTTPAEISSEDLRQLKRLGLSDERIATEWKLAGHAGMQQVRELREGQGIRPVFKLVDTCAAEFESMTPYLYSTYDEEDEAPPTQTPKIIILGSGPNRIGQGIEFDYCCCHAAFALKEDGYETIMVNCNPETVSTDYDTSDRLYFEPLTLEDVLAIYNHEAQSGAKIGMIVQFGGQTPLNLAQRLRAAGVPIIGTSPESIDLAEDRKRFGKLLEDLQIPQPRGGTATSVEEALAVGERIGYPVLVRPSYVLGGRAMVIAYDAEAVTPLHARGRRIFAGAPGPRRSLPRKRHRSRRRRALRFERCRHRRHHAAHRRSRHPLRRLLLRAARRRTSASRRSKPSAPTRASWRSRSKSSASSICSSPSSATIRATTTSTSSKSIRAPRAPCLMSPKPPAFRWPKSLRAS